MPTTNTHRADQAALPHDDVVERDGCRVLRRLAESGACLAVAEGMEKAVVVREVPGGETQRTGVVDATVAEAMALREWISAKTTGRVTRYQITAAGRATLKRMLVEGRGHEPVPAQSPRATALSSSGLRHAISESPLVALSRRRDKDGSPFLAPDLLDAGERLREDFELAQMGAHATQDWDRFLIDGTKDEPPGDRLGTGCDAARIRVQAALAELGPGLGDVVLRVCCYLEGMESVERRMGWAARSGKIVLRIALQRLRRHYDTTEGRLKPMIG